MKKQEGITLIALIITIIVMLILVGVTINVAMNGGLMEKAGRAKEDQQKALETEQLQELILGKMDDKLKIPTDLGTIKIKDTTYNVTARDESGAIKIDLTEQGTQIVAYTRDLVTDLKLTGITIQPPVPGAEDDLAWLNTYLNGKKAITDGILDQVAYAFTNTDLTGIIYNGAELYFEYNENIYKVEAPIVDDEPLFGTVTAAVAPTFYNISFKDNNTIQTALTSMSYNSGIVVADQNFNIYLVGYTQNDPNGLIVLSVLTGNVVADYDKPSATWNGTVPTFNNSCFASLNELNSNYSDWTQEEIDSIFNYE